MPKLQARLFAGCVFNIVEYLREMISEMPLTAACFTLQPFTTMVGQTSYIQRANLDLLSRGFGQAASASARS